MHVGLFFTNSSICRRLLATTLTLQLGGDTSECLDGPDGSCGVSRVAGSRVLLSWIGIVGGAIGHDLATSRIVYLGFVIDVQVVLTGCELWHNRGDVCFSDS